MYSQYWVKGKWSYQTRLSFFPSSVIEELPFYQYIDCLFLTGAITKLKIPEVEGKMVSRLNNNRTSLFVTIYSNWELRGGGLGLPFILYFTILNFHLEWCFRADCYRHLSRQLLWKALCCGLIDISIGAECNKSFVCGSIILLEQGVIKALFCALMILLGQRLIKALCCGLIDITIGAESLMLMSCW